MFFVFTKDHIRPADEHAGIPGKGVFFNQFPCPIFFRFFNEVDYLETPDAREHSKFCAALDIAITCCGMRGLYTHRDNIALVGQFICRG